MEALKSPLMGLFEKRRARNFFVYVQNYNEADPVTHQGLDLTRITTRGLISWVSFLFWYHLFIIIALYLLPFLFLVYHVIKYCVIRISFLPMLLRASYMILNLLWHISAFIVRYSCSRIAGNLICHFIFRKHGLSDDTVDFIGHALALHRDDHYLNEPALDTVKRMKVCLGWRFCRPLFLFPYKKENDFWLLILL